MVSTSELESYLNDKSAKKGDRVKILSEGTIEVKEDAQNKKIKYKVLNLPVNLNGTLELIWSPGKLAVAALNKMFGTDTKTWVNKEFIVDLVKMQVKGELKEVIFPLPVEPIKK